jgi:sulfur-oxidizing protein SoxY
MPHQNRRHFIFRSMRLMASALALTSGVFVPFSIKAAWKANDFSNLKLQQAILEVFGEQTFITTKKIKLKLPRIAENGKVVPITITSTLKEIDTVAIFAEHNPFAHIASFRLFGPAAYNITARLKMAASGYVIVIVKTRDEQYFSTQKMVKVTVGGCGG